MYRPGNFSELPEVVKNLLILNGLFFLATVSLNNLGIDLVKILGLHQFQSPDFRPHQLITHLFMHGNFTHLFFNMFALWMFGKILENVWGSKRFLIYYMITGIGAASIHLLISQYQIISISNQIPEMVNLAIEGRYNPSIPISKKLTQLIITPTVGASGAVFGLLLAFGMLFPNALLYLYFAIPIKAKYFVIGYGLIELYAGISNNPADNVAHFAHLGGMIFGFFLIKYWKKDMTTF
ncbi:MAG: rhomboid family intramembrane serine protease [Flavobacteriales bacterium]|nr:rhomboid family intramembrane serine protease [Flavobacteriales bacterium]OUW96808.1 MAG: rhomboid family intramembrane serine protease [Flavobacteriales bacterium TMED228]|tara:strand:- start:698 stop:1408 length:711 start_codon:yes stop_codon:yes gene_type:complete